MPHKGLKCHIVSFIMVPLKYNLTLVDYYRLLIIYLPCKAPNTTIADLANTVTVDPDEKALNEPSDLDLQCLPSRLLFFQHKTVYIESFSKICNFADIILSSAFLALDGILYLQH